MEIQIIVHKLLNADGKILDYDVSLEYNDWICLNDHNGNQFDSCEAYHASEWANKYGNCVVSEKIQVKTDGELL